jgi:acetylornithine deacetylase
MKRPLDPKQLLAEMVSRPSPSGQESKLTDWLEVEFQGRPFAVTRLGDSLLCTFQGSEGPTLLCHSHHDTIAAGAGWSADPCAGWWGEGRLVGLGANDAGASVVSMVCALEHLASMGEVAGTVHVALCAQEETTNAGMAAVIDHLEASGSSPDGAICGEPTGLEVVRAQSGLVVLLARWSGKSCHAARALSVPHDNALLAAAREVSGLPPVLVLGEEHQLLGPSTIVPAAFTSGDAHNRIPDRAELLLDARLAPPHDAAECVRQLNARLPSAEIVVKSDRLVAVETAADHPLVIAALEAADRDEAIGSATMSDMALLSGVPCIKCGPGRSERSHTPDEFVTEDELLEGVRFYTHAISSCLDALASPVCAS